MMFSTRTITLLTLAALVDGLVDLTWNIRPIFAAERLGMGPAQSVLQEMCRECVLSLSQSLCVSVSPSLCVSVSPSLCVSVSVAQMYSLGQVWCVGGGAGYCASLLRRNYGVGAYSSVSVCLFLSVSL